MDYDETQRSAKKPKITQEQSFDTGQCNSQQAVAVPVLPTTNSINSPYLGKIMNTLIYQNDKVVVREAPPHANKRFVEDQKKPPLGVDDPCLSQESQDAARY